MKCLFQFVLVLLLSLSFASCWDEDTIDEFSFQKGEHTIKNYIGYVPLQSKPIDIAYYIPGGDLKNMKILFVFPGEERNAMDHVKMWENFADKNNVMVFGFKFSTDNYPSTTEYILGGISTSQSLGGLQPREKWLFNFVEKFFEDLKITIGSTQTAYDLWGHSAGAQFVHRFVMFQEENYHGRIAIAANSGWYTVPDLSVDFPYGLNGVSEIEWGDMHSRLFSRRLVVQLGTADTNPAGLNTNAGSQKQGKNRFERGTYFFDQSASIATKAKYSFGWKKREVDGIDHDAAGMQPDAAKALTEGWKELGL